MARYCNKCERKMGFFEQNFDGMCKECYNISIEEERKRLTGEGKQILNVSFTKGSS